MIVNLIKKILIKIKNINKRIKNGTKKNKGVYI